MEKGKIYFIKCTKGQYPEVKRLLGRLGFSEYTSRWEYWDKGVVVDHDGEFHPYYDDADKSYESTLSVEELRKLLEKQQHICTHCRQFLGRKVKNMEEKTIKEWLEELPDGYRERALANCEHPEEDVSSMAMAIRRAFVWDSTTEGIEFWAGVHNNYSCSKLPPLPTEK